METKPPDAFLSYTRFDDRRRAISAFREHLQDAVREVTGKPFEIFQDVDDILIGERWSDKLDQMLDRARFFIPILTPSYFNSAPCRRELEKFLEAEERAGRHDLILPVHYIRCPVLEDRELREGDPLATAIDQRHRWEWWELRHYSFRARKVRLEIEALALEIAKARQARVPSRAAAQDSRKIPPPGTVFRDIDAPWCPEMVAIPPGEFMMGAPEGEEDREEFEGPQHLVKIGYPLAVGRYPLTFDEYDHFSRTTGRELPGDEGWGRGRRPVINVSWEDANAYAEWLAATTGKPYRLLSEAEWEYACRAGTTARYWWPDELYPEYANYEDTDIRKASEVGSYAPNPWGLYDMHGNVREWVEDCWNDTYEGAPDDGSAWTSGDCEWRVLRGGSWDDGAENLAAWARFTDDPRYRKLVSFRVARTLYPWAAGAPWSARAGLERRSSR